MGGEATSPKETVLASIWGHGFFKVLALLPAAPSGTPAPASVPTPHTRVGGALLFPGEDVSEMHPNVVTQWVLAGRGRGWGAGWGLLPGRGGFFVAVMESSGVVISVAPGLFPRNLVIELNPVSDVRPLGLNLNLTAGRC